MIVAPSGNDFESTQVSVGKAAADYLNGCLCKNDVLGLAWGYVALKKILPYIKDRSALGITTVQLMGGVATSEFVDPQRIVSQDYKPAGSTQRFKVSAGRGGQLENKKSSALGQRRKGDDGKGVGVHKGADGIGSAIPRNRPFAEPMWSAEEKC